jgi:hypothetical protein
MPPSEDRDPRIGTVLQDRYKILAPLGQGGMGVVYRGERVGLGRPVAIKFLQAQLSGHDELRKRFEREARAMSRLQHPHCVPVIDFGIVDDVPYIVLELVPGRSLRELLLEARLPALRTVKLIRQVLAGLAHAHELGIVHRDIKPANIVVSEAVGAGDQARILDFGLAKIIEGNPSASVSAANVAIGTPAYMSPEQGKGGKVDARSDIYAVGVLLFELLTGKKPFVGKDLFETLKKHELEATPSVLALVPDLPPEIEGVIQRAMAKLPDHRFPDAVSFSEALAPIEADLAYGRKPIGVIESSRPVRDAEPRPALEEPPAGRSAFRWLLALLVLGGASAALWTFRERLIEKFLAAPPSLDAGWPDAGWPDAAPIDASLPDATPVVPDAGLPDALVADAAAVDAGLGDAGLVDAGSDLVIVDAAPDDDAPAPAVPRGGRRGL